MIEASTKVSAFASHSYEVLCSRLDRTVYFLQLKGIDALAEDANSEGQLHLMMHVFELRSQIEDAEEELELDAI